MEETKIEDGLNVMNYPLNEPKGFPSKQEMLNKFYKLKIFSVEALLKTFCSESEQLHKDLGLKSKEHLQRLMHEFSILVLSHSIQSVPELKSNYHPNGNILKIGAEKIDQLLGGGLRTKLIIELSGESSSGKSQFCLQYLLQAQLPKEYGGLSGDCVYISTESSGFQEKRCEEISVNLCKKLKLKQYKEFKDFSDHIMVAKSRELVDFERTIYENLPSLCEKNKNIRLIIIDSIAALYRVEFGLNETIKRSESLFKLSSHLKNLASKYDICVLIVNQVSAVINDGIEGMFKRDNVVPALGLSWSHCIDMRIMISKTMRKDDNVGTIRKMNVIFSPYCDNNFEEFYIDEGGIKDFT